MASDRTRVFISYAWENNDYRARVKSFAARLRQDGINARLDAWHLRGQTIPEFMASEVRNADKILILCSPLYRTKVHAMEDGKDVSGSGWEAMLVTSAIWNSHRTRDQIVAVLFQGTWAESSPDFLSALPYIYLTQERQFEANYENLLRKLTDQQEEPPSLGNPVEFTPINTAPLRILATNGEAIERGLMPAKTTIEQRADTRTWYYWLVITIFVFVGLAVCGYLSSVVSHRLSLRTANKNVASNQTSAGASATPPRSTFLPTPLTLRNLFDTDFPGYYRLDGSFKNHGTNHPDYILPVCLLVDLNARSMFLATYIPDNIDTRIPYGLSILVATHYKTFIQELTSTFKIGSRIPGETMETWSSDSTFSGRVFVYCDADFTLAQLATLDSIYRQAGLSPEFRGQDYLTMHWNEKRSRLAPGQVAITLTPKGGHADTGKPP
jgi:hypothetical protein